MPKNDYGPTETECVVDDRRPSRNYLSGLVSELSVLNEMDGREITANSRMTLFNAIESCTPGPCKAQKKREPRAEDSADLIC